MENLDQTTAVPEHPSRWRRSRRRLRACALPGLLLCAALASDVRAGDGPAVAAASPVRPVPPLAPPLEEAVTFVPELPDPGYAVALHPPMDVVPERRIGVLVHPTLGFPALTRPGHRLVVLLHPPEGVAAAAGSLSADDFSVVLRLRRGPGAFYPEPMGGSPPPVPPDRPPFGSAEGEVVAAVSLRPTALRPGETVWELEAEVPLETPALTWDLGVSGPSVLIPGGEEVQPLAVRVLPLRAIGAPDSFRLVFMGDHQLWDPSSFTAVERNAGTYPTVGVDDTARALALQVQHEVSLLAPAFVLYGGDLSFGIDYNKEVADSLSLWRRGSFASFLAPGNHDGYAHYALDLPGGADAASAAWGRCWSALPDSLDALEVLTFLGCVYGDTRDVLFAHLVDDGLVAWERAFGPAYYAFDHGRFRFIVLNTYDGSAPRRHAYVIGLGWAGLPEVGVATVDNYGGFLSPQQLSWLERVAREGTEAGRKLVVLGHHDFRGNPEEGERYLVNDPFPTSPLGLGPFEEWNYDGDEWDSEPGDGRGTETMAHNSGTALATILARYGGYYLSAHAHEDADARFEVGEELVPGVFAEKPLELIRVTTASSATRATGYAGYRVITAHDDRLEMTRFDALRKLPSVPAGNIWLTGRVKPGLAFPSVVVEGHNALPRTLETRFTLPLPEFAPGYEARLVGPGAPAGDAALLPVADSYDAARYKVMAWSLTLNGVDPHVPFPPAAGKEARTRVVVKPRPGNHPPRPVIEIVRGSAGPYVTSGDVVVFSGAGTTDPDGEAETWRLLWSFGDGGSARGDRVSHVFVGTGDRVVRVLSTDRYGASAHASLTIQVRPPTEPPPPLRPPRAPGCACRVVGPGGVVGSESASGSPSDLALVTVLFGALLAGFVATRRLFRI